MIAIQRFGPSLFYKLKRLCNMPTFGEFIDEVGASQLSELHEAETAPADPEPDPQPTHTHHGKQGYVVRRKVGSFSQGLVSGRVLTKSEAEEVASRYNEGRKPGDPRASVYKLR